MSKRAARAGFIAYSAATAASFVFYLAIRFVVDRAQRTKDFSGESLNYLSLAMLAAGAAEVLALVATTQVPSSTRARPFAVVAAATTALYVLVGAARQLLLRASFATWDTWSKPLDVTALIAGLVSTAAFALVAIRVGRASGSRVTFPLALLSVALYLADGAILGASFVGVSRQRGSQLDTISNVLFYASSVTQVALAAIVAFAVMRVVEDVPRAVDNRVPREWACVAEGVTLYLGGASFRIACAFLSYVVMLGAQNAEPFSSLRGVRDDVVILAALSALGSVAMLVGVFRISRAPRDANVFGPALRALACMILGLLIDGATTWFTADALGGSLSAAFAARDALPVLGAIGLGLGVFGGYSLLASFRNAARALSEDEIAMRAESTSHVLLIAGGIGAVLLIGVLPGIVVLAMGSVIVPAMIFAAVQVVRTMLGLSARIRARLAPVHA